MTTSARCAVCKNSDMRRLIELGWNAKMSCPDLAHAFGNVPSASVILRHLKEHTEGGSTRSIEVEDARPMRDRVLAIQREQIEAIERQLAIAEDKALEYRTDHQEDDDYDPARADPSWYFDILSKDMQAAVSSILKAQGLTDKREATKTGAAVDMFRLLAGKEPPKHLIGDGATEGEFRDVTPD